jgi:hypothetical protein
LQQDMGLAAESQKTSDTGRDFRRKFPQITRKPEIFRNYDRKMQLSR